jgi:hypothetical protein
MANDKPVATASVRNLLTPSVGRGRTDAGAEGTQAGDIGAD